MPVEKEWRVSRKMLIFNLSVFLQNGLPERGQTSRKLGKPLRQCIAVTRH